MKNMKKTDEFQKAIEAAGLAEAFGKMCTIASETIGVHLDYLIDDAVYQMENPTPETKPVWRVFYQDRWLQKQDKFWAIVNEASTKGGVDYDFASAAGAMAALERFIKKRGQGVRVETSTCGGFGIDLVIDEATAKDEEIVHWKLRRQYRSKWETVETDQG